jgi:acyl dehydratase
MKYMTYSELAARRGEEIGVSSWITIDQNRIDRFAEVSGDDGFIHVDAVRAATTPFGGTIAHGLLVLSLAGAMGKEVLPAITDRAYLLNYGYDKVRFISPVAVGGRVRGRYRLDETSERAAKERFMRFALSIEREGSERPALIADWLLMVVLK